MKKVISISANRSDTSREILEQLDQMHPPGVVLPASAFRAQFVEGDSKMAELVAFLEAQGLRKKLPFDESKDKTYGLVEKIEYDAVDLEHFRYLTSLADDGVNSVKERDEDGCLLIERRSLTRKKKFVGTVASSVIFVSSKLKKMIESSGMIGVRFVPTKGYTGDYPSNYKIRPWSTLSLIQPLWEMASDIQMPPLSPLLNLVNRVGEPMERGTQNQGVYIRDGDYIYGDMHYLAKELNSIEPFDFAYTRESLGPLAPLGCRLPVFSQRFYQLLCKQDVPVEWRPIHVDSDCE